MGQYENGGDKAVVYKQFKYVVISKGISRLGVVACGVQEYSGERDTVEFEVVAVAIVVGVTVGYGIEVGFDNVEVLGREQQLVRDGGRFDSFRGRIVGASYGRVERVVGLFDVV